jgi:hypothetical protein
MARSEKSRTLQHIFFQDLRALDAARACARLDDSLRRMTSVHETWKLGGTWTKTLAEKDHRPERRSRPGRTASAAD